MGNAELKVGLSKLLNYSHKTMTYPCILVNKTFIDCLQDVGCNVAAEAAAAATVRVCLKQFFKMLFLEGGVAWVVRKDFIHILRT